VFNVGKNKKVGTIGTTQTQVGIQQTLSKCLSFWALFLGGLNFNDISDP